MGNYKEIIQGLIKDGWTFKFEAETNFIGMYHKKGGKRSICEMKLPLSVDNILFGQVIADYLNSL